MNHAFSPLPLAAWRATRDALQAYALVVSRVRSVLSPSQPHFFHLSLFPGVRGLSTGPIPASPVVELTLDPFRNILLLHGHGGTSRSVAFPGMSQQELCRVTLQHLDDLGAHPDIAVDAFGDQPLDGYDPAAAARFWTSLLQVDAVLRHLRAVLPVFPGYSAPVQFWPHHFDLALLWFTGRLLADADPRQLEQAAQQLNFGFSTGDDSIPEPYLYATVHPNPEGLQSSALPAGRWESDAFQGAVLPYAEALQDPQPAAVMHAFLEAVYNAGAQHLGL